MTGPVWRPKVHAGSCASTWIGRYLVLGPLVFRPDLTSSLELWRVLKSYDRQWALTETAAQVEVERSMSKICCLVLVYVPPDAADALP